MIACGGPVVALVETAVKLLVCCLYNDIFNSSTICMHLRLLFHVNTVYSRCCFPRVVKPVVLFQLFHIVQFKLYPRSSCNVKHYNDFCVPKLTFCG